MQYFLVKFFPVYISHAVRPKRILILTQRSVGIRSPVLGRFLQLTEEDRIEIYAMKQAEKRYRTFGCLGLVLAES